MSKYVASIRVGVTDVVIERTITGCDSKAAAWRKARTLYQVYPHWILTGIRKKRRS